MIAVDTNLVVRYLVGDDENQSAKARRMIDSEDVFVPTTVVLETEWVLRGAYGFSPSRVANALRAFAGLPRVEFENLGVVHRALQWMADGLDFADALHLAGADGCGVFLTFDQDFIKAAKAIPSPVVRSP